MHAACLSRIFHTDLLRRPGSLVDAVLSSKSSSGSMYSYSRRQTSSLALPHKPSQSPRHDQYEISGLTDTDELCHGSNMQAEKPNKYFPPSLQTRALIFDLDDTLLVDEEVSCEALRNVAEFLRINAREEQDQFIKNVSMIAKKNGRKVLVILFVP